MIKHLSNWIVEAILKGWKQINVKNVAILKEWFLTTHFDVLGMRLSESLVVILHRCDECMWPERKMCRSIRSLQSTIGYH